MLANQHVRSYKFTVPFKNPEKKFDKHAVMCYNLVTIPSIVAVKFNVKGILNADTIKIRKFNMKQSHVTFEEHEELLYELIRLQLYHLPHWLKEHPDEKFADGLRKRTDLCRKTAPDPKHFDVSEHNYDTLIWRELESALTAIYEKSRKKENIDFFELTAFKKAEPFLANFARKTYGSTYKFEEYQCGSLKYDPPEKEDPKAVTFHIGNAVAPKSIFTDPGYLENCFFDLMDQTEKKFGVNTVKTNTWLNSLPKWLEYFPEEWQKNLTPEDKDIRSHLGFWGQFISAKGTFNTKYAQILRDTGKLPFYPRASRCSFSALREHLEKRLKK